jgi:hypothetical protein
MRAKIFVLKRRYQSPHKSWQTKTEKSIVWITHQQVCNYYKSMTYADFIERISARPSRVGLITVRSLHMPSGYSTNRPRTPSLVSL